MHNFRNKSTDKLINTIINLDSKEDCYKFFEDLLTIKEFQDFSQRFETAILLDEGVNYQKISKEVGISTATISRVKKCLDYGDGGYKIAINKLKSLETE